MTEISKERACKLSVLQIIANPAHLYSDWQNNGQNVQTLELWDSQWQHYKPSLLSEGNFSKFELIKCHKHL
jgi:hypothetical protein